jgi:hypothetical protein
MIDKKTGTELVKQRDMDALFIVCNVVIHGYVSCSPIFRRYSSYDPEMGGRRC